jgi:hypothetical protein
MLMKTMLKIIVIINAFQPQGEVSGQSFSDIGFFLKRENK